MSNKFFEENKKRKLEIENARIQKELNEIKQEEDRIKAIEDAKQEKYHRELGQYNLRCQMWGTNKSARERFEIFLLLLGQGKIGDVPTMIRTLHLEEIFNEICKNGKPGELAPKKPD